jgi:small subunit ribosomal protein S1
MVYVLFALSVKTGEGSLVTGAVHPLIGTLQEVVVQTISDQIHVLFQEKEFQIPASEFETLPLPQSTIPVLVIQNRGESEIRLSHRLAKETQKWKAFAGQHAVQEVLDAKLLRSIKGGYLVDIGVSAFLPNSHASLPGTEVEPFETLPSFAVEIIELNPEKQNAVVSRKNVLIQQRKKEVSEFLKTLEVGQVCEGVVQDLTDFGAFIRIGLIDGLLHIKDMSWDHIHHPRDLLEPKQKIQVKILKIDPKQEKVSLGLKQMSDLLWDSVVQEFPVQSSVTGTVVSLKPFGAFIRLKHGLEGLLHISQVSRKKIAHPSEVLQIGQEITTVILSINPTQKRIALGMRQLESDPWKNVSSRYILDQFYKGTVTGIVPFGAFVQLEEGIEGLIHISKLSTERINSPREVLEIGEEVTVSILEIKEEEKRIRLSLIQ